MPKLLQICVEGNTGSNGRLAEAIGEHVINNNWESYICFARFPRPSKSVLIKIGNLCSIYYHGFLTRIFDKHCLGSRNATLKLIEDIKQIQPDIIQLHHLHGYYINIEILFNFLKSYDIPVIWTFHDCWSITGHCTHFTAAKCDRWKTQCFECPQIREYPASLVFDNSKTNFILKKRLFNSLEKMTIVSVSKWLNSVVNESFMRSVSKEIIYNGIDTTKFHPLSSHSLTRTNLKVGEKFIVLGVANPWSEKKGLEDFIKLSALIDNSTIIVLVGLNKLEIKRLPLNIIGLERTEDQEQLKDLYACANLFINFSVEETFGLTTAESLSCGTPALVYNTTACPEIIDVNTGFVISFGDFDKVIEAIEIVRRSGKHHYIEKCRSRALELFDIKDCLINYYNLYEKNLLLN